MSHKLLTNTTGRSMEHPDTGQLILPGQMYAVPIEVEEEEPSDEEKKAAEKEAEKQRKAAEKAEKDRQKAEEERLKAEEEARLKAEADAAAAALAAQGGGNTGDQ